MKITITVDNKKVEVEENQALLPILQRMGYFIPTLCHHEELVPYGACRVCIVEQVRDGWSRMVTSCNFPVKDGQVFRVHSEKLLRERQMVMEFILARSSNVPEIISLAKQLGVEKSRFPTQEEGCILCGLCIRACDEVVGAKAISFAGRGPKREISSPFFDEAKDCIGCGSCAYICPTRYIEMKEDENYRYFPLWKVKFEMVRCKKCGQKIAPKKQLEFIRKKANLPDDWFDLCINCRP